MLDYENVIRNLAKLGTLWCRLMHNAPMWPIHGSYQCRTCGRRYRIVWAGEVLHLPVAQPNPLPARTLQTARIIERRAA